MGEPTMGIPAQCTLALNSYRLAVLPEQTRRELARISHPSRAGSRCGAAGRASPVGRRSRAMVAWRASGESLRIGSLGKEPWAER